MKLTNLTPQRRFGLLSAAALVLVGGCGGGSDGLPTPAPALPPVVVASPAANIAGTDVPPQTTQSIDALIGFAKQVQASGNDQAEPLLLGDITSFASDEVSDPTDV